MLVTPALTDFSHITQGDGRFAHLTYQELKDHVQKFAPQHIMDGVYLHWSTLETWFDGLDDQVYFGVCDDVEQILAHHPDIKESAQHFVVGVIAIRKEWEPDRDGWRWHKWGEYIGTQKSSCEYLADEPEIEQVYVYQVHTLTD
jgi:hypothetical protein